MGERGTMKCPFAISCPVQNYQSTFKPFLGSWTNFFTFFLRIANGKVTSERQYPPFFSGAELEFACNPGYLLLQSGSKKIHNRLICHDLGHWMPPRGHRNPKCIPLQCDLPRGNPFGRIISRVKVHFYISLLANFYSVCLKLCRALQIHSICQCLQFSNFKMFAKSLKGTYRFFFSMQLISAASDNKFQCHFGNHLHSRLRFT